MAQVKSNFLSALLASALVQTCLCESHLSSRTPYDSARGPGFISDPGAPDYVCKPEAVFAYVTPGSTYPTESETQSFTALNGLKQTILDNARSGKGEGLDPAWLKELENWELSFSTEEAGRLTDLGQKETTDFIHRLQSTFPSLFSPDQSSKHYIRSTTNPGARDTADAITKALYGHTMKLDESPDLGELLENGCKSWENAKKWANNFDAKLRLKFLSAVVDRLKKSWGVDSLEYEVIGNIYRLCTYETALKPETTSPWCTLFTETELQALEYEEDLMTYWTGGEGSFYLSRALNCQQFNGVVENFVEPPFWKKLLPWYKPAPRVTIQLAHKVSLRAMLTRVGKFSDRTAPYGDKVDPSRLWRNSAVSPSLGNLVFVLNSCSNGEEAVTMFVNEKIVDKNFWNYAKPTLFWMDKFVFDYQSRSDLCIRDFCTSPVPH